MSNEYRRKLLEKEMNMEYTKDHGKKLILQLNI